MAKLSVNISKIAALRNARDGGTSSVALAAGRCQESSAEGVTVHPGFNERYITYQDVRDLREVVTAGSNIEGYLSDSLLDLACSAHPEQVTPVPDKPDAPTSDSG